MDVDTAKHNIMSEAQAMEGKKRKRTGKQREEAKRAAIQAKLEAEAAAPVEAEPVADVPEVAREEPTEAMAIDEPKTAEEGGKKRKRTGKMREEAKRLAIAAKLAAEGGVAPAPEAPAADVAIAEPTPAGPDFAAIEKRIQPALKKLHPVFKQAKTMESMRLIKKVKFLRGKGEEKAAEVAELEGQMKLLSALQLRAVATAHLAQKLKKHHLLKRVELPESITVLLTAEPSIAASSSAATPDAITKAENRLCSSKPVADAMKTLVAFVMGESGASLDVRTKAAKAPKGRAAQRRGSDDGTDDESDEESEDEEGLPLGRIEGLESDDEVVVEDRAADDAGWESGSLGGGSDDEDGDDDGWESGSVSGLDGRIAPPSDSGNESDASDVPPRKRTKEAAPAPAPKGRTAKADGKSSMFLPSLASGFAPAGEGDSDPDNDYDPDGIFGSKVAPRKNRRGQRARQAIWEKKYGKGANHVVKAREDEEKRKRGPQGQKRDSGWGQRSGAGAGAPPAAATPAAVAAPGPRASAPAAAPKTDAKADPKSLHPSWEAARLRKQREAVGAKATKIVFD